MRAQLVKDNVVSEKEAAKLKRDELEAKLKDTWSSSWDNLKSIYSDTDMRQWLIDHGYMKSDYQAKKDEIYDGFKKNYKSGVKTSNDYLDWGDNRIRTWLRDHGVDVPMKTQRQELIQLMKENYSSSKTGIQGLLSTLQDYISSGIDIAEDTVQHILDSLSSASESTRSSSSDRDAKRSVSSALSSASSASVSASKSASSAAKSLKSEL